MFFFFFVRLQRRHRVHTACCTAYQRANSGSRQRAGGSDTSQPHPATWHQHQNQLHLHNLHWGDQHYCSQFERPAIRGALCKCVFPILLQLYVSAGWQVGQKHGTGCQASLRIFAARLRSSSAGASSDYASYPSPSSAYGTVRRHFPVIP